MKKTFHIYLLLILYSQITCGIKGFDKVTTGHVDELLQLGLGERPATNFG
jgi:hypothetical protein